MQHASRTLASEFAASDYRGAISNQSSGETTEENIEVAKKSHGQILGNEAVSENLNARYNPLQIGSR
jgi:hypothetical protein